MSSAKWTKEQVKEVLEDRRFENDDWTITEEKPIQNATQFVLRSGTLVNLFTTGMVHAQGTPGHITDEANKIFKASYTSYEPVSRPKIFVVYGHDTSSRDLVEGFIKEIGLVPIILDQLPGAGNTIIEQLEDQIKGAAFACVLLTPDDEGYPKCKPKEKKFRARQNVILELGLVAGKLGRDYVAVFHKGNLEMPSDIRDLIYIALEDPDQAKRLMQQHLKETGIHFLPTGGT